MKALPLIVASAAIPFLSATAGLRTPSSEPPPTAAEVAQADFTWLFALARATVSSMKDGATDDDVYRAVTEKMKAADAARLEIEHRAKQGTIQQLKFTLQMDRGQIVCELLMDAKEARLKEK